MAERPLREALIDVSNLMGLPNEKLLQSPEDLLTLEERRFLGALPLDFLPQVVYDPNTEEPRLTSDVERAERAEAVIFRLREALRQNNEFYEKY